MSGDPLGVCAAFAAAVASNDEAAAAQCVSAAAWASQSGDSPRRLFDKAAHPQRGFAIDVKGTLSGADSTRAAVRIELVHEGQVRGELQLLGEGAPWKLAGVTKKARLVDAFVGGKAPALLEFEAMPVDGDAADAVVAISALSMQAAAGSENAAALVSSLMNESEHAYKVVGYLQQAARTGLQVRVQDARRFDGLGRSVVKAVVRKADPNEPTQPLWLYAERGPPIQWYAQSSYFSPDTLLADA